MTETTAPAEPQGTPPASPAGRLSDPHEINQTGLAYTATKPGDPMTEWQKHLKNATPQAGLL